LRAMERQNKEGSRKSEITRRSSQGCSTNCSLQIRF
jgi:hypothetical protein